MAAAWKQYLKRVTEHWPPFSTTGQIHIHGILVTFRGMAPNPLVETDFVAAVEGGPHTSPDHDCLKRFYEDVSRGLLRVGCVTAETFVLDGNVVDEDRAYEEYFRVMASLGTFQARTHFMFGFGQGGASGYHRNYVLRFDSHMPNRTSLIHEFGHNLGLYHATTPDNDRGDHSDRMGARDGYVEFNAPNLLYLRWLDECSVVLTKTSGRYALTPLEFSIPANGAAKVVMVQISEDNFLYLSLRERIGPYDSRYLDHKYAGAISVHTRTVDSSGRPKKTLLLGVVHPGGSFRIDDLTLLRSCRRVEISDTKAVNGNLSFGLSVH